MSDGLEELRKRIDQLDTDLLALLKARAEAARAIGSLKEAGQGSFFDPGRERKVLDRILQKNAGAYPPEALVAIYREIISASRGLETKMVVGFLGLAGGFAEFAATKRFGSSPKLKAYEKARGLFRDLGAGHLDFAMIPRDVGDEDRALQSFDLFFDHEVLIFGEYVLRQGYAHLKSPQAGEKATIFGHPTALGRCQGFLSSQSCVVRAVGSSREAADLAVQEDGHALGPEHLQQLGKLDLVAPLVEDEPSPRHRFLILGRTPAPASGHDRTSMVCVLANEPHALSKLLDSFSSRGVNISWLEIRESRHRPWEHAFFLEVDGYQDSPEVKEAIDDAKAQAAHLQLLGSYPIER